jgi:hypothetical protein
MSNDTPHLDDEPESDGSDEGEWDLDQELGHRIQFIDQVREPFLESLEAARSEAAQRLKAEIEIVQGLFFDFADQQDLQKEHAEGSKTALMLAMASAAQRGEPAPEWAAQEFVQKVLAVLGKRTASWDEAFGKPHPPRTNYAAIKRWNRNAFLIYDEVEKLRTKGHSLESAFAECANILADIHGEKFSESSVRDYYRLFKKRYGTES